MHHSTLPISSTNLGRHVHEALNLPVHVTIRPVSSVFSPLAAEHTSRGSLCGHRSNGVADERQLLGLVEPGPTAAAGGEQLIEKGGVDDADGGHMVVDKGNGDAEHGEEMDVVYRSCVR